MSIIKKKHLVLARLGEIALKGLNRHNFEQRLFRNLQARLKHHGKFSVHQSDSRIWISPCDEEAEHSLAAALNIACHCFGIVSASLVIRYEDFSTMEEVIACGLDFLANDTNVHQYQSFKVETKRGDKRHPLRSQSINIELGAQVLDTYQHLKVDVHHPDFILRLELRDGLYIYNSSVAGVKGLPVGTSAKGMVLLSGGIDSPVAAYMMASRGMALEAIYFHTYPYTSDRAKEKVIDLARILCNYTGKIKLHIVDFTETQLSINASCPTDMLTITMRRLMMRVADELANRNSCVALITGESLGQVASQTAEALATTDMVATKPVFRPLIGTDKDETIRLARQIETYETSILPYEDCCTVFVAKHPRTRPSIQQSIEAEQNLDINKLVNDCLEKIETLLLSL